MADFVFRALIVDVDDYGRMEAKLSTLKAGVFPLRPEITLETLEQCLRELERGDEPPLVRYVVDGRVYLQLTGWERHRLSGRRAKYSKFPPPPAVAPSWSEDLHEIRGSRGEPRDPGNPSGDGDGDGDGDGKKRASRLDVEERHQGEPDALVPAAPPFLPRVFLEQLANANPLGVPVTPAEVESWFAIKLPSMRAAGRKNLKRTAAAWWARVTREELDQARRRLRNLTLVAIADRERSSPIQEVSDADVEALADALEVVT